MLRLRCGGRGPCCHVGYAHRHCEHCDLVIPSVSAPLYPYGWPYGQPWPSYQGNSGGGFLGALQQSSMAALAGTFGHDSNPSGSGGDGS